MLSKKICSLVVVGVLIVASTAAHAATLGNKDFRNSTGAIFKHSDGQRKLAVWLTANRDYKSSRADCIVRMYRTKNGRKEFVASVYHKKHNGCPIRMSESDAIHQLRGYDKVEVRFTNTDGVYLGVAYFKVI